MKGVMSCTWCLQELLSNGGQPCCHDSLNVESLGLGATLTTMQYLVLGQNGLYAEVEQQLISAIPQPEFLCKCRAAGY